MQSAIKISSRTGFMLYEKTSLGSVMMYFLQQKNSPDPVTSLTSDFF